MLSGAVLTGGLSRRMGYDKALLRVSGETILARTLRVLGAVCDDITIIGDRPEYHDYGFPVRHDMWPRSGPLGGLATAVSVAEHAYVLCLACDMPFVSCALLWAMADLPQNYDALVPRSGGSTHGERIHPLHAIYARRVGPVLERQVEAGNLRIADTLALLEVCYLDEAWLRIHDPDLRSIVNVNTPYDRVRFGLELP